MPVCNEQNENENENRMRPSSTPRWSIHDLGKKASEGKLI